jgi:hypothetical protein
MTKLDEAALVTLISADEHERLEFKRTLLSTKGITEYAVALGNEGGGWLIIGVTNNKPRAIVGVREQSHDELLRIQSAVFDSAGIKIRLHPISTSTGWVLAIDIPSRLPGKIFHTQGGKYLMRAGESLRGMPNEEIAAIFTEVSPPGQAAVSSVLNELRTLAAEGKIVTVHPIVPGNREGDDFQIDAATNRTVSLGKVSSGHHIELPLQRVKEVLYTGERVSPTLVLQGRLQWIGVDGGWRFFADAPTTNREKMLGFEKMSGLNDPRVRELQQQLEPRGIRFHFAHERDVPTLIGKRWELFFDTDGRFFRIINGNESLVLMALRS